MLKYLEALIISFFRQLEIKVTSFLVLLITLLYFDDIANIVIIFQPI